MISPKIYALSFFPRSSHMPTADSQYITNAITADCHCLHSYDCTALHSVLLSMQIATTNRILTIADSYRVSKSLMSSGKFWMVSPDPEQPVTPHLVPIMKNGYYYKFGVFLDYDCRASKQYLDEVSASHYTGLFISPSGISELDCATTKKGTAERSILIGRESLQVFFVLGALAYFQVPPLGGSRDEKWRSQ